MSKEKALQPVEQKMVVFYDDEITAVLVDSENEQKIYLPLRHLCSLIGVNYQGQKDRIDRDPVLSKKLQGVSVTLTPSSSKRGGGSQVMNCLPLTYLNGWLFGINANRVKVEIRDKLIRYQEECYQVLFEAFKEGRLTADPAFSELLKQDIPEVQAYKTALAIVEMARQQVLMASRLNNHEERLELIEATLGDPTRHITEEQATQVSQAIRAIALTMSKRSGRNEYGATWGEFYRQFGVAKYRHLPAVKFDEAIKWLRDWYSELTDDTIPF